MANPFISNGTCYTGPGIKADAAFIPCGNDALGHKTCCGVSDMCLSSRACYNGRFGVTYLLGCSDPEYRDPSCPDKIADDNSWVGLVYCNGTSEQWAACPQAAKESTLAKPDTCFCPETSRTVAFTDKSVLENIASLPTATGASILWQTGHYPTANEPTQSATNGTPPPSPPSSGSDTTGAPTSPPTPPANSPGEPQQDPGLSTGAKIGIGVGIGAGAILVLAALAFVFLRYRRKKKNEAAELATHEGHLDPSMAETKPSHLSGGSAFTTSDMPGTPATTAPSELEPNAARPWSLRSELAAPDTPTSLAGKMHGDPGFRPVSMETPPPAASTPPGGRGALRPVAELPG